METRYISLEAAEQVICDVCERPICPTLWGDACDSIDRLKSIPPAADVVPAPRWIPVKDRLPLEGKDVLAWEVHGFAYVDHQRNGKWVICDDAFGGVTHWMPLPQPPKEGGGEK